MRRRRALIMLAGAAALAGGCSSPDPVFYTLRADPAPARSGTSSISIVVGPVTLPEAVDRPQLVTSTGENRVEIQEFHRWAQPLKSEIPRVVAAQLGRQLGTANTGVLSDVAISEPDYRVLIDVQRFDSRRGEAATVEALWTVRARSGGTRTGHTRAQERVADASYEAMVAAQGRALGAVSTEIGNAIEALQR
jgi:uncharacterized lipoprotein YmbA